MKRPIRHLIIASCALFLLILSPNILACEAAGANTHVGNIVSLDRKSRILTIMDMATQKPIQFTLNDALMIRINGISGQVVVRYSGKDKGRFIATQILQ